MVKTPVITVSTSMKVPSRRNPLIFSACSDRMRASRKQENERWHPLFFPCDVFGNTSIGKKRGCHRSPESVWVTKQTARRGGEMVDTLALGASGSDPMEVQVLSSAHKQTPPDPSGPAVSFFPFFSLPSPWKLTSSHQRSEEISHEQGEKSQKKHPESEQERFRNIA